MALATVTFADIFWAVVTVGLALAELAVAWLDARHNQQTGGALPA